ncbi:hypothetical protein SeLEV6574_g00299 [Synchytrium endobioticum]|uniref:Uncharacterized protein n=1 Tax=Synchytrium endobioticum TaxID=286115 RepID=A0A507DIM8_9FUNG|nr:hypothetical protein SeLEV6574_g00299 [Synchytrium endobioticum]
MTSSQCIDIRMKEQTIQILVAELDEIRARVVQPTDTFGIAQKNKDYKLAKTAVEVGQRDLRAFMRDAKTRYVNVVVANPATVTGGPLATSSSSQVIKIEDPSVECMSSIRIALQVNETIRQAELNSKMKSITITSIVSSSSPPRRSSTSTLPMKNDPSRPGPFAVNPEKSIHRIRAQNGWCTRCGMKSHNAERYSIYPATKSNKENFESWLQMRKNTSIKIAALNSICENNTCDEPLYEVAVDDENTAEICAYLSTIGKRQLTQTLARKQPPHFFINFTLLQGEISTQGKALVDSTRSFIGSSFLYLHKIATVPMKEPQRLTLANGRALGKRSSNTTIVLSTRIFELRLQGY